MITNFKYSDNQLLRSLYHDLSHLNELFQELFTHKKLLNDKKFLSQLAKLILTLNRHAERCREHEEASLIHFLLKTPIGAPFVFESTFLESANFFFDSLPKQSALHDLLEKLAHYHSKMEIPFLKSLLSLENSLETQTHSLKKVA